ncbi:hypothetical protein CcaverHIS002_0405530 [Cutaneotrichosporon cavernicola]|nr:hypothetical protein CcaverHIS002_0405530 [Cutaneotrichosporon cavernicola]
MGVLQKIEDIEKEMSRTQKNKGEDPLRTQLTEATEYHLGLLKAKLAKYRAQLLEPEKKSAKGEGFDVLKSGDARVCLIGFPSVGKSTLLSKTTKTESAVGAYEFTTLTSDEQRAMLVAELEEVGIRLNTKSPDVVFKQKTAGGITITCTVKLTKTDERMIRSILQSYRIHNCDVMIREDITIDEFIDVLLGTRKYIPALTVNNKIDAISMETLDHMARQGDGKTVMISCEADLGLDWLLDAIWKELGLVKVYTKKRGEQPDLGDPICLRAGATIETVCHGIHRGLASHFKYALVWGKSSKFNPQPQKVGLSHQVMNEDVVSIFTK